MIGYGKRRDFTGSPVLAEMGRLPDMGQTAERTPPWEAKTLPWSPPQQGGPSILELLAALLQGQDDRTRYQWGQDAPKRPRTMDVDPWIEGDLLRQIGAAGVMDTQGRRGR